MVEKLKFGSEEEKAFFQELFQLKKSYLILAEKYSCVPRHKNYTSFKQSVENIRSRKDINGDASILEETVSRIERIIEAITIANKGLCNLMAKKSCRRGLIKDYDTAFAAAFEKLPDCIFGYDIYNSKGAKFPTYACMLIKSALKREQRKKSIISIPNEKYIILSKIIKEMEKGVDKQIVIKKVRKKGGYSEEDICLALQIFNIKNPSSIDAWREKFKRYELPDKRAGIDFSSDNERQVEIMLSTLPEREKDVLCYRFGILKNNIESDSAKKTRKRKAMNGKAMTLKDIADIFKCTKERIRQIESKALKKLYFRFKDKFIVK